MEELSDSDDELFNYLKGLKNTSAGIDFKLKETSKSRRSHVTTYKVCKGKLVRVSDRLIRQNYLECGSSSVDMNLTTAPQLVVIPPDLSLPQSSTVMQENDPECGESNMEMDLITPEDLIPDLSLSQSSTLVQDNDPECGASNVGMDLITQEQLIIIPPDISLPQSTTLVQENDPECGANTVDMDLITQEQLIIIPPDLSLPQSTTLVQENDPECGANTVDMDLITQEQLIIIPQNLSLLQSSTLVQENEVRNMDMDLISPGQSNEIPPEILPILPSTSIQDNDPDYDPESDREDISSNTRTSRSRKRKILVNTKEWKGPKNKLLREHGKEYLGWKRNEGSCNTHNAQREKRVIGPTCRSEACRKSKMRNCDTITEEQRKELFEMFWAMTWEEKRMFVINSVLNVQQKRPKKVLDQRRRTRSLFYYLTVDSTKKQVCKKMFRNTLCLGDWSINSWVNKSSHGMLAKKTDEEKENYAETRKQKRMGANKFMEDFIDNLPKLPSHYCRMSTKKLYLEPSKAGMIGVYNEYKAECGRKNEVSLSITAFNKIIQKKNISFQSPKKDLCDLCESYKVGHVSEEAYQKHIQNKAVSRAMKELDKTDALNNKCIVLLQDLQSVKVCPYTKASALYYKRKLCVHNFTVYEAVSRKTMCYWFTETESDLQASVFTSCLTDYMERVRSQNLPIIIWSDGCTAQNRNSIMANGLLNFAVKNQIPVYQKYLQSGHTQMEVDSVHAMIEKKIAKQDTIYLPSQYVELSQYARAKDPYDAKLLTHDFLSKYDVPSLMRYDSIRPGKKKGDPCVSDLKVILYKPDGTIHYKLDFNDEFKPLPHRPKNVSFPVEYPKLFQEPLKITKQKYKDLQDLKPIIPLDYHYFYDHLPN